MKSQAQRIINFATSGVGVFLLLLALAVCIASAPAHAQENVWKVDSTHSVARLSLGSGSNSIEVGITPISGTIAFDTNDPADPVVNVQMDPRNAGGDARQISFKSKRSEMTSGGKIAVTGDLSVTRIERSVTMDASEGYYGVQYGDPVAHTDTQEVTLVFPSADLNAAHNGILQLTAATNISRERFPQLLTALSQRDWQRVAVEDESCSTAAPATGEGYYGPDCTGNVITTASNTLPSGPAVGEGYYGFESAPIPDRSQATITFDLRLTAIASAPSGASYAANTSGH